MRSPRASFHVLSVKRWRPSETDMTRTIPAQHPQVRLKAKWNIFEQLSESS
jgi:hypothetical protein